MLGYDLSHLKVALLIVKVPKVVVPHANTLLDQVRLVLVKLQLKLFEPL